MRNFLSFLAEAASEEKLKHLEHAEDHPINAGAEGFKHAVNTLNAVHNKLLGKKSNVTVTTKYDGSPSIVFGHHPENGNFFVASKSAFNKNPKLNYSEEDVVHNHGHAPGLVEKLQAAYKHLSKVTPKKGVYQGDLMYSEGDVKERNGSYSFKPNTITYSADKNSEHGQKLAKAKLGVVVHTEYKGDTLEGMKAQFGPSLDKFKEHQDVHLISPHADLSKSEYSEEAQKKFAHHMKEAAALHSGQGKYGHIEGHQEHIKTYINSTVRDQTTPGVEGYKLHLGRIQEREVNKLKSVAGQNKARAKYQNLIDHVHDNAHQFQQTFELHHHLQRAKDVLVNALDTHEEFGHSIDGTKSKGEGHVAVINNRPTKLVNRAEFSRANFLLPKDR